MQEFFDWRYRASELYDNLTMFVLPNHAISLNFVRETAYVGDSAIFGLILGIPKGCDGSPAISLYNTLFPNRSALSFQNGRPNPRWGSVDHVRMIPLEGVLTTVAVSRTNDMIVATSSSLIAVTAHGRSQVSTPEPVILAEFHPIDDTTDVILCTHTGKIFHHSIGESEPVSICEFGRPVIDMSIDPYRTSCALVTQGKTHVHMIDSRDGTPSEVKMPAHTSAVAFAPNMPFMFAAGQTSGVVTIHDTRMPASVMCSTHAHDSGVTSIRWSPHRRDVIASGSHDATIAMWSIRDAETAADTLFTHRGHITPIVAFEWSWDVPWTLASISEDNVMGVWTVAQAPFDN